MKDDPTPPATRAWWKTLPVLLVAIAGVAAGAFVATRDAALPGAAPGEASASGDAAPAEEARALETLQGSLRSSQVLPSDFRTVPPFTLAGGDGEPLTEALLEGRWSLMFFGYTNCPDVCPITLSVMQEVVAELEAEGPDGVEPMQVVFVTVDPTRDTPERMAEYVAFFDEDFVPVSGELNAVHELIAELGIVAAFTANEADPDAYIVDHTASMLLVDPERRVRAKFAAPHEAETIVADYRAIRSALN